MRAFSQTAAAEGRLTRDCVFTVLPLVDLVSRADKPRVLSLRMEQQAEQLLDFTLK